MTSKSFESKFRKDLYILNRAAIREVILPIDQPKLYKKVKKYFESEGVQFYNEIEADYEYILSLITEELKLDIPA
jgi:hypothetical protein